MAVQTVAGGRHAQKPMLGLPVDSPSMPSSGCSPRPSARSPYARPDTPQAAGSPRLASRRAHHADSLPPPSSPMPRHNYHRSSAPALPTMHYTNEPHAQDAKKGIIKKSLHKLFYLSRNSLLPDLRPATSPYAPSNASKLQKQAREQNAHASFLSSASISPVVSPEASFPCAMPIGYGCDDQTRSDPNWERRKRRMERLEKRRMESLPRNASDSNSAINVPVSRRR